MANWINDGGHGGKDPGAVSHGNTEKVYTLEAALYVDKRLGEHGIGSHCTRSKDETLSVSARTSKVSKYKYCISHHYNAGGGDGAEFIHSIYADGKFEHTLKDEFEKAGYPTRRVFCKKGTNGDYYYMHRQTGACRTTIVEYDFVDGPQAEKIKNKSYREGMYECVVRAICRQEGVDYKPVKKAESKPAPSTGKLYKVQTGAFSDRKNAEALAANLEKDGYATYIVEE
jgi:N-acetylmuramoyl-L-alanine amidase